MRKPHVHAELIKKWADGAQIQCYRRADAQWVDTATPAWDLSTQYRIKPEPVPDKVYYDVVRTGTSIGSKDAHYVYDSLEYLKINWPDQLYVKLTIKTDVNGKETKIVEIVD